MTLTPPECRVAGVLLAAGRSTRMGEPKALVTLRGVPLVRHAAQAMNDAGYAHLYAVIPPGEVGAGLGQALQDLPFSFITNPDPARGLMSSFREAAAHMPGDVQGVNFVLADMPFLTAAVHDAMLDAFRHSTGPDENRVSRVIPLAAYAPVILAEYSLSSTGPLDPNAIHTDAVRAPPHLFRRDLLRDMLGMPDADHGPRELLKKHAAKGLVVRFPPEMLLDIDTPEALAQVQQRS